MSTSRDTFVTQLLVLLASQSVDTTKLPTQAQQAAVQQAVEEYSRDRPDTTTADVTGTGARYYAITTTLFAAWSEGFSQIKAIEYPAITIASGDTPQYLEPDDWRSDYRAAGVRYLYLPRHTPAATEKMRVTYTVPYSWSGTASATTTPAADFYAICNLSAAIACEILAVGYSPSSEAASLMADAVNHRSKAQEYASRAKEFRELYARNMGFDQDKRVQSFSEFVDWDTAPNWPTGRDYLFHGDR